MGYSEIVKDYKNNEILRRSFNDLACKTFEIDFEEWFKNSFWDDTYTPFSFVENSEVVSNVSTSRVKIISNSNIFNAIQIGTVMTKEEHRKKGLATQLMKMIIADECGKADVIFLFPNEREFSFYEKLGFTLIYDKKYSLEEIPVKRVSAIKHLNMELESDKRFVEKGIKARMAVSNRFDSIEDSSIRLWYLTYSLKNMIYYISELNSMVVYELKEDVLHLYDIISNEKQDINEIVSFVIGEKTKRVKLYFTPDNKFFKENAVVEKNSNPLFYLSQKFSFPSSFSFPYIARA